VYKKINLTLLNHLLHLIMDHNLNNTVLTYKNMAHTNTYGLIHGLHFSAFAFQYYGLMPNNFLQYRNSATKACHPIQLYSCYIDQLHVLFCFTANKAHDLISDT
ncbi:RNA recognition motif of the spliceosomal PrP8-domain-containing protein, partial [Scleroderma citrinum]